MPSRREYWARGEIRAAVHRALSGPFSNLRSTRLSAPRVLCACTAALTSASTVCRNWFCMVDVDCIIRQEKICERFRGDVSFVLRATGYRYRPTAFSQSHLLIEAASPQLQPVTVLNRLQLQEKARLPRKETGLQTMRFRRSYAIRQLLQPACWRPRRSCR